MSSKENNELAARFTQIILRTRSFQNSTSRNYIFASEVSNCIRQTYYKLTQTPVDEAKNDDIINLAFGYGNMFESVMTEFISLSKMYEGKVRVADSKLNISGETDPVIFFEGKHIITEMKATHRKHYEIVVHDAMQGKCPDNYYAQLQLYLWLAPEADLGFIIIGNRDMRPKDKYPPFIVLPVERDLEWKKKNFKRLDTLNESLSSKNIPDREFTLKDWQCQYCQFKDRCWEGAQIETESYSGNHPVS